ncbi:MAG TPA: biotin/lipoyl-containing protein [Longimicrobiales bacterium]|nr:biotin/lipoyl-containing protein [Longimicrobiales bacterium]
MLYHVTIGARTVQVELEGDRILVDGEALESVELAALPGTAMRHLLLDGRSTAIAATRDGDDWQLAVDGWPLRAAVIDERTRAIRAMTGAAAGPQGPKPVRAPMPGLVVRVEVAVGDTVRPGQPVVAMEAMKMENELKAEGAGVVSRILTEPGKAVEKGTVLVEFEAVSS